MVGLRKEKSPFIFGFHIIRLGGWAGVGAKTIRLQPARMGQPILRALGIKGRPLVLDSRNALAQAPVQIGLRLLALATPLSAQQPPASDPASLLRADAQLRAAWATEWLHSDDQLRCAWGAWLAGRDHRQDLIPLLNEAVAEYRPNEEFSSQNGRDHHDALLSVLDALISLGATVPAGEARKLYPEYPAQSLIFLVRSPKPDGSALLDIARIAKANWNWLAAGNVLVKNRVPGFAALLLARFTQHLIISVVDAGMVGYSAGAGSECGFSMRAPKASWPAVGLYVLTQFPERLPGVKAIFLVAGDTHVYYLRVQPGNYDNPGDAPGFCDDGNRDQYRAQYLGRLMANSSPQIELDPYPCATIARKDDTDHRQQLLAIVEGQRTLFRRAIAPLEDSARALTRVETETLKPRIEILIHDDRANKSGPLPALPEQGGTVLVQTNVTRPLD
jgi:hypothetical protein